MSKIYFYKLTVDDGGAPCVENKLLSLAICKPSIRRTSGKDDTIIGFAANSLHSDNRLIYVAKVTEKLENGDYYRKREYSERADCIYQWRDGQFVRKANALYHGAEGNLQRDLGMHPEYANAKTLLSKNFCYFGAAGSNAYKKEFPLVAKALLALGQGHRVNHDAKLLAELEELTRNNCGLNRARICGEPTSKPHSGANHRGGGSCVVHSC